MHLCSYSFEQFQDSTGSVLFKQMHLLTDIYEVPTVCWVLAHSKEEK